MKSPNIVGSVVKELNTSLHKTDKYFFYYEEYEIDRILYNDLVHIIDFLTDVIVLKRFLWKYCFLQTKIYSNASEEKLAVMSVVSLHVMVLSVIGQQ